MEVKIPNHVAIILDGNGRWATEKGKKRKEGHYAGYKNLKKLSIYALKKGIKYLSVYAFSTENFNRSEEEVNYLMDLFISCFKKDTNFFNKRNVKVVFSGRKKPLRKDILDAMKEISATTKNNTGGVFNICLNYGGQAEIVDASKNIVKDVKNGKLDLNTLDEKTFYKYLYNNLPPIDFMIRTSGELRISNFMLYELSYAELYFPETYFPDFNEKEFDKALIEYTKRDRRFGKIKNAK
ncbi:MAG: di-trans,poly-cis-decaprenylcistransferase [Bacilli bacterium]|nr:di-trans,poly-cis-decaprenylcistransferase [Bacilli bacterium]